jgi:(2R)-sulfolactate sulfo-lyase subunit alpha
LSHKFLVHRHGDHVGVAVDEIAPGESVDGVYMDDDSTCSILAREMVPFGHKIAIVGVEAGSSVIEYGVPIGIAPGGLEPGVYVHTHNLRSARW